MKEEFKNNLKKLTESKTLFRFVCIFGVMLIAIIIFQAGAFVGFHKASYSHAWEENYERNFGIMHRGFLTPLGEIPDSLPNAHGALGKIIKIELPIIIIEDSKDKIEKVILISDSTKIRNVQVDATKTDLKVDSDVVVIGTPNAQGQIDAKFIRIMPAGLIK